MFCEKLKKAMRELNLNQRQVCGLTGCSKGSVSQYLTGKNVPPAEKQSDIAVSLGLAPDYFEQDIPVLQLIKRGGVIPRIRPEDAAKLMRMDKQNIRRGLQQGEFPWGYAVRTSEPSAEKPTYAYYINATAFAQKECIDIPEEMVM